MLAILAIVPLVAAALASLLLRDRHRSSYTALAASVLSLILVLYLLANNPGQQSIPWFSVSGFSFTIGTAVAPLNALMLLLVAAATPVVLLYSMGFMNVPSEHGRYYFELCLAASSMMLLAMASNLVMLLISWEVL